MSYEKLENARLAYKNKLVRAIWICAVICAVIFGVPLILLVVMCTDDFVDTIVWLLGSVVVWGMFAAVIIMAVAFLAARRQAEAYRKAYKGYFVAESLRRVFTNITYYHDRGMPREVLASTGMINMADTYSSNDFVMAKYGDVNFMQADVKIQQVNVDGDGNTTYVTTFKGRWMTFEFKRKFDYGLEVAGRKFGSNVVPRGQRFKKIEMESQEFNKLYKVYAQDGFEAFYLLEPSFIQSVCRLGEKYHKKVLLCFVDRKLHVGIYDGKDALEAPWPWRMIDEGAEFRKVEEELRMVTEVVDSLKLDR